MFSLPFTVYRLLLISWEKLRLNMMIGRVFWKNEVEINCVDFCHDSAITKQALMALTAPKINCVDFCHDSAITKQALMALTAPKVENLGNFGRIV